MNLDDVREGLENGQSFMRFLDDKVGYETVRPTTSNRFEHVVMGYDFGGVVELDIDIIDGKRFSKQNQGWELMEFDPGSTGSGNCCNPQGNVCICSPDCTCACSGCGCS